ncbi:uncharacterized protein EV420DRAFT_1747166 [Desarmillaria tabescens]|uniref:Mid2 domain-containing protein n=1 Tax=Armillaria tabescens TaxID=1929756 RepID=A0AA39KHM4_ARMTA|nr:uncharacterized protein EV420DRAFT_1747166 [Desarmillaria tabescens]KAK0460245.1 hypothetical protein EV420DRAFT_1747166 [Desarmillaria tabescens]
MASTLFHVFINSVVQILKVFDIAIKISTKHAPQAGQECMIVLAWKPHDPDRSSLPSFASCVTSGRGREWRSVENLLSYDVLTTSSAKGVHLALINPSCGESLMFRARSHEGIRTNEVLSWCADKDLSEEDGEDLTIHADSGEDITRSRDGGIATSKSATTNDEDGRTLTSRQTDSGNFGGNDDDQGSRESGDTDIGDQVGSIKGGTVASCVSSTVSDATELEGVDGEVGSKTHESSATCNSTDESQDGNATYAPSGGSHTVYGEPLSSVDPVSITTTSGTSPPGTTASASTSLHNHVSTNHTKVIIGSTLGSLTLVVIILLSIFFWRRKKTRFRNDKVSQSESPPTDSRPGSVDTPISSSSSPYLYPFAPSWKSRDFPSPRTRTESPPRVSSWRQAEENQIQTGESRVRLAVESAYGEPLPPSYRE